MPKCYLSVHYRLLIWQNDFMHFLSFQKDNHCTIVKPVFVPFGIRLSWVNWSCAYVSIPFCLGPDSSRHSSQYLFLPLLSSFHCASNILSSCFLRRCPSHFNWPSSTTSVTWVQNFSESLVSSFLYHLSFLHFCTNYFIHVSVSQRPSYTAVWENWHCKFSHSSSFLSSLLSHLKYSLMTFFFCRNIRNEFFERILHSKIFLSTFS